MSERHISVDSQIEEFKAELDWQAEYPPTGDQILGSFCLAMSELIAENTHVGNIYREIYEFRDAHDKHVLPSSMVRLSTAAIQKQLLMGNGLVDGRRYPHDYTNPVIWAESIERLFAPEPRLFHTEVSFDIAVNILQSNVASRYKGNKLSLALLLEPSDEPAKLLDVGCSVNHGLKKMASRAKDMRFYRSQAMKGDVASGDVVVDRVMSRVVNEVLDMPVPFLGVGVDPWPARDEPRRKWIESCSFYPSELLNQKRRNEYARLDRANPPNVTFEEGDFSVLSGDPNFPDLPHEDFDIVSFFTVLYQFRDNPGKVQAMLDNAFRYVKPDGLIIVQDFARTKPDDPETLEFIGRWFEEPYSYRTLVYDMAHPEDGFQEFIRWENARCKRMAWGEGTLSQEVQERGEVAA